jgi:hypothetical protein
MANRFSREWRHHQLLSNALFVSLACVTWPVHLPMLESSGNMIYSR